MTYWVAQKSGNCSGMTNNYMTTPIDNLREQINGVDLAIIDLLEKRFALSKEIGELKAAEGREVHDPSREAELARIHSKAAREHGLSEGLVSELFVRIIDESRRTQ